MIRSDAVAQLRAVLVDRYREASVRHDLLQEVDDYLMERVEQPVQQPVQQPGAHTPETGTPTSNITSPIKVVERGGTRRPVTVQKEHDPGDPRPTGE